MLNFLCNGGKRAIQAPNFGAEAPRVPAGNSPSASRQIHPSVNQSAGNTWRRQYITPSVSSASAAGAPRNLPSRVPPSTRGDALIGLTWRRRGRGRSVRSVDTWECAVSKRVSTVIKSRTRVAPSCAVLVDVLVSFRACRKDRWPRSINGKPTKSHAVLSSHSRQFVDGRSVCPATLLCNWTFLFTTSNIDHRRSVRERINVNKRPGLRNWGLLKLERASRACSIAVHITNVRTTATAKSPSKSAIYKSQCAVSWDWFVSTFVPKTLLPKLTFMYRSWLYRYFVCTESDCIDIDIQCTKSGCTEKTCTESVCTETVLYRKRRTPIGVGRFRYRTISVHTLSVHVFSVHPVSVHWKSVSVQSLSIHTKYRYSPIRYININFGTSMLGTKIRCF